MDLDEDLKRMQMLATAPQLYRDFVALNAVQSLVGLLGHENVGTVRARGTAGMRGRTMLRHASRRRRRTARQTLRSTWWTCSRR